MDKIIKTKEETENDDRRINKILLEFDQLQNAMITIKEAIISNR